MNIQILVKTSPASLIENSVSDPDQNPDPEMKRIRKFKTLIKSLKI